MISILLLGYPFYSCTVKLFSQQRCEAAGFYQATTNDALLMVSQSLHQGDRIVVIF